MNRIKTPYALPIWKQLITDAPFAWHQRNEATQGLQFTLPDLVHSDQTLEAYLDALRIAKQAGACLHKDLNFEDWGAVFIGIVLGLRFEDEELLDTASAVIGEDLDRAEELEHAIRWPLTRITNERIVQWQTHENPAIRRAAVGALYADANPEIVHNQLQYQLHMESHPIVLARLLEIAGNQRHAVWNDDIAKLYQVESLDVQFHAIRAGVLLGDRKAFSYLNQVAREEGPYRAEALELYLRAGKPEETKPFLTEILQTRLSPHLQCQCVAWAGYPEFVPFLIRAMAEPLYARTAGYAVSLLSGVDIMEKDLDWEFSENDREQLNTSESQREVYRPADEGDWPWPAPQKIQAWWEQKTSEIVLGIRYLAGYPITQPHLDNILLSGTQPQRQAAALERSLSRRTLPVFDIKAYAPWQQQRLRGN